VRHGSLFSGIGGFDLAAEWMGWENVFHCEWNPFCQKVLAYHFPKSKQYHDITKTDFTIHRGTIDILTGGFPCQPYSVAGKQKGTEDERHLWPEMLRAIREIQPTFVVGENVPGLVNWSGGLVFEQVQADLEAEGYEVTPFLLPAAGVNAPHQRERIWFIAYAGCYGGQANAERGRGTNEKNKQQSECLHDKIFTANSESNRSHRVSNESKRFKVNEKIGNKVFMETSRFGVLGITTDTDIEGLSAKLQSEINGEKERKSPGRYVEQSPGNDGRALQDKGWENFPTVAPICDGDDGLSSRLDSITFPQWRTKAIMAGGNAIVPQVALQIFKAIEEYDNLANEAIFSAQERLSF